MNPTKIVIASIYLYQLLTYTSLYYCYNSLSLGEIHTFHSNRPPCSNQIVVNKKKLNIQMIA